MGELSLELSVPVYSKSPGGVEEFIAAVNPDTVRRVFKKLRQKNIFIDTKEAQILQAIYGKNNEREDKK